MPCPLCLSIPEIFPIVDDLLDGSLVLWQNTLIQGIHPLKTWHISCFNGKSSAHSFFSSDKVVSVHHGNSRSGTSNSENFEGLLALEGGRKIDSLESNNTSPRRRPNSSTLSWPLPSCLREHPMCSLPHPVLHSSAFYDTLLHHFSTRFPYQSSNQHSLSSHYSTCTLQALSSHWILQKLSMISSFPVYRRQNRDQDSP